MITGELKSKVDRIWDTMWSGGISNPLSVIEQLTYLLLIKQLDELQTLKEHKAARTGRPIEDPVFTAGQEALRWTRFKETAPEQMFETVRDEVFPFIKTLGQKEEADDEEGPTYTHHMEDALFMMPTARVLANVVDQLDGIDTADSDTKGDLYEYMLGKIATAGQNGQFRTPRHIIRLMVDMTAPTPKDVICDPACGTAGFLIAASEYLRRHDGDTIYKDAAARRRFNEGTFHGYDFDNTMLRIGSMNMLLHGVKNPDIRYRDSLAQADEDDAETYSLILANPPFAGSLDYESTARDLQQIVKTKKTELLFLALFLRLLQTGGRAAVIVPDGVLFGSSKAHKTLHKILVEEQKLDAIVSMPSGVFKPYAGVSTAILLFTKTNSGGTDDVWFYDMQADGFSLDDKRTPQPEKSDLTDILARWQKRDAESARARTDSEFPGTQVRDRGQRLRPLHQPLQGSGVRGGGVRPAEGDPGAAGEIGGRDREWACQVGGDVAMSLAEHSEVWPEVELGEVCEFAYGKSLPAKSRTGSGYSVYGSNGPVGLHEEALTAGETIVIGRKGSFGEVHYSPGPCSPIDTTYYITQEQTKAYLPWLARRLRCLDLDQLNRAAAIPGLNRADAYRQTLLRPPLAEQKRIARILDAADALRAKRRESIAQLDTLLQSTFHDMFGDPVTNLMGWEVSELGELANFINGDRGKNYPSRTDFVESGIPFFNAGHLIDGEADFGEMNYIGEDRYRRLGSGKTKPGDILYCLRGSLGKTAIVRHCGPAAIASSLVIIHPLEKCCIEYLFQYLISPFGRREIHRFDNGSSQPNLSAASVKKYKVCLPPLDLQHRFAAIVESVEQQKARQRAHLDELDTLFASLQYRAFGGDL